MFDSLNRIFSFENEPKYCMNLLSKCLEQLPSLVEVKRNLPFIITGTVAIAIIFFSKQDTTIGERQKIQPSTETSKTQPKLSEDKGLAGKSDQTQEIAKKQPSSSKHFEDEEEKKESSEKAAEVHRIGHHNFLGDKGGDRTSGGGSSRYSNRKNMNTSQQGYKKGGFAQKDSNSNDDSDGSYENANIGKYGNLHPTIGSSGLIEHDLFNINVNRYSQGENEEDERGDKMSGNDQVSENNSQYHQLKSLVPREKRQKRAPIKINRNFATDTENNEKLQKLKSIVQKEKKLEDKVFFQMFLNIVGTEADEDNDD